MDAKHAALLCLFIAVLAPAGDAGPGGAATDAADRPRSRSYLKKHPGGEWRTVRKGPEGSLSATPALEPTASLSPFGVSSGLFKPYVARPTGSWPEAVAIGDVNGDGRNDVVLTTSYYFDPANDQKLHVFLQDASGNLQAPVKYPLGQRPESVDIGDVNGDGRSDVVVGNFDSGSIGVLLQNAAGSLIAMVTYPTVNSLCVRIGDFNHDGRQDVVGINWGSRGDGVDVFLQNAGGTLDAPVTYHVAHGGYDDLEVGDVNSDGLQDVIVMSGQGLGDNVGILLQQPAGGFGLPVYYDVASSWGTAGVGVGDVDGDSRDDVVVSYGGNRPSSFIGVFTQNGAGTLNAPVSLPSYDIPEPVEIADVNDDGRNDVLTLHGGWTAMGIYLQNPAGTLAAELLDPVPYASHYNPHGLAVGDINSDGYPDVAIADYNYGLVILYHRLKNELGLTMTDFPDPLPVGSNVTYTLTVTNHGFAPMTGVTLTDTLPPGMTFVSSVPDSRTCTVASRVVTCRLGTSSPGTTVVITIVATVPSQWLTKHKYVSTAQVVANEAETDSTDNSAAVSTRFIVPCSYPLVGGGFEQGTPNPSWAESSTNFGTPLCTLASCGNGGDTAGPRSGTWWAWFGGLDVTEAGSLTQNVVLPIGSAWLRFFLWNGAASGNGTDTLRVLVDGQPVFSRLEGEPTYMAGYVEVRVDLSRFADGAVHALRFESLTSGPQVTSFSVDDVLIEALPPLRTRGRPFTCP